MIAFCRPFVASLVLGALLFAGAVNSAPAVALGDLAITVHTAWHPTKSATPKGRPISAGQKYADVTMTATGTATGAEFFNGELAPAPTPIRLWAEQVLASSPCPSEPGGDFGSGFTPLVRLTPDGGAGYGDPVGGGAGGPFSVTFSAMWPDDEGTAQFYPPAGTYRLCVFTGQEMPFDEGVVVTGSAEALVVVPPDTRTDPFITTGWDFGPRTLQYRRRPSRIEIGEVSGVHGLRWSEWGRERARGTGTWLYHRYLAGSGSKDYLIKIRVTLERPVACGDIWMFSRMVFTFPGKVPPGIRGRSVVYLGRSTIQECRSA